MTPRVAAKAPVTVRVWTAEVEGYLRGRTFCSAYEARAFYQIGRPVIVRIVREADYRRLLHAAAGKRGAKR